ncbi:MAG: bifunctional UDP-N-acetylglucosamine diphosphorylase/glucosamine-1-phosphate N-acetyltransferase GlmU [Deltaproteobacteria bacterium]|nr:bifunctional UDP-N-acetylglucosamine diphosphorylase/glucosamine-1-phosphate N-acetyltransferase GlmU [Deltaproteobacteria bacterium]
MSVVALVLAAGKGKRMKSSLPKVLHPVLGQPIISYVIEEVKKISPEKTVLVVGYGADDVKKALDSEQLSYVMQSRQLGTAHAVLSTRQELDGYNGTVVILYGDSPLIRFETLRNFINTHRKGKSSLSILTARVSKPHGYGRIIRNGRGEVTDIVEEKDATPEQKTLDEINSGIYCVESDFLWNALDQIDKKNNQKEYYLTDIVGIASRSGIRVKGLNLNVEEEIIGINNRIELYHAEEIMRKRINENLMLSGVTIIDPEQTFISPQVSIGIDTVVYPHSFIYGKTKIGSKCKIGPSVWIQGAEIEDDTTIGFSSFIEESSIGANVMIGPFAHIRPGSQIMGGAKIGSFVEIKKSIIGTSSKVPHLSYVGDATVGKSVNIGAGTITCNYDGFQKHETIIEDDVFIGSDTMLVAPVRVGRSATTGAGSTITKDVESKSLAIGRAKQITIKNWKRKPKDK